MEKRNNPMAPIIERRTLVVLLLLVLVALSYRLWFGADLVFPIDNDAAYYRAMGTRLGEGFGTQNLVWHYLTEAPGLVRPSFDYWMPLPAVVSGLSGAVFGGGPGAETLPGILASAGLTALCFLLACRLGLRLPAAAGAGLLSIFLWPTTYASLDGDSPIFAAFFINAVFLALTWVRERPRTALVCAGTALALAHLSRSDAVLLLPTLALWWAWERKHHDLKIPNAAWWAGIGTYLLLMSPFMVRNLALFSTPLPPGTGRAVWATSYYQIYSSATALSPGAYFGKGMAWVIGTWQTGLSNNVAMLVGVFPVVFLPFFVFGAPWMRRTSVGRQILLWAVLLLLFHGTALAVVGGFKRSYVALLPLVLVAVVGGWQQLHGWLLGSLRRPWAVALTVTGALLLASPAAWFVFAKAPDYRANYSSQTAYDLARHTALDEWFEDNAPEAIIASPKPFFIWYATGRDCVMVPYGGAEELRTVVRQFAVTHLVVDLRRLSERPDQHELHAQVAADRPYAGFVSVTRIADLAIYELARE